MQVVSIIPWPPYTQGNSPHNTLNRTCGFHSRYGGSGEEKKRLFLPGIKPLISGRPSRNTTHFYCPIFSAPEEKKSSIKKLISLVLLRRYYCPYFILIPLNMEIHFYQNTRRHIPADGNRHSHPGDNLRSYFNKT